MKNKGHTARKRFGQNFLQDTYIIEQIIQAIAANPSQHLVEIGPGLGALTERLISQAKRLDVIEIDRDLCQTLNQRFADQPSFQLHQADALKFNFSQLFAQDKLRIIGNLPYNISTPLLFHLFSFAEHIEDMHFMLQKEVVDRLAARHGNENFGRLSLMAQYHCHVEALFTVPPTAFSPQPKVQSAIVRLTPHQAATRPEQAQDYTQLQQMITTAFTQRRKTIANALKKQASAAQLAQAQINPQQRPETLSLAQYVRLSNIISNASDQSTK